MKLIVQKKRFMTNIISKSLILVLGFCFSLNTFAGDLSLQRIEPEKIEHYQSKLARNFKKNSYVRTALVGGLLVTAGYAAYKIYSMSEVPNETTHETTKAIGEEAIKKNITPEFLEHFKEYIETQLQKNAAHLVKEGLVQKLKRWSKEALVFMVNQAGAMCILDIMRGAVNPITKYAYMLDSALEKSINSVFYTRTLPWFLEKHTQLFSFLDEIEKRSNALEAESNETSLALDYKTDIAQNWEIVVEQVCSTVAYMNIMMEKKSAYSPLFSSRGKAIIEKVVEIINTTTTSIEQSLNSQNKPVLSAKIKLLKFLLQQEFDSFHKIELAQL